MKKALFKSYAALCAPQRSIVSHLEITYACLQCKARVEPLMPLLALLMYGTHGLATRQYKSLHPFGSTIGEIANVLDREVTATDLLAIAPLKT